MISTCPNCHHLTPMEVFYSVENIPVHSVLLMNSREEALNYPKRDIELGFCSNCGFIANVLFDKTVHEYSSKYEETQGFSETFNKFHYGLAKRLIEKYHLYNKKIIEIGCGKGDFITMLSELGNNEGFGFDPAFLPDRNPDKGKRVHFIQDFYSEKYAHFNADFICCKMTLEHIPDTYDFVKMVRNAVGSNPDCVVFFQIPDTSRILRDMGFWDIYYEHCSYFTIPSLSLLFEASGFEIIDIGVDYDDQYLMIETKPSDRTGHANNYGNLEEIHEQVLYFKDNISEHLNDWKKFIKESHTKGETTILWGGGSKAVAFLTTLGIVDEIRYAVDINPFKHGTFLAGNGQEIIAPQALKTLNPDKIIVMNPVYIDEITRDLNQMSLHPEILSIEMGQRIVS